MKNLVRKQRIYFDSNATKSCSFRKEQLANLYKAVEAYENELLDALYKDLGKSPAESYITETGIVKSEITYIIKNLKLWTAPRSVSSPLTLFPSKARIYQEPLGVSLIISPWNYPVQLTLVPLAASIAAGNCAIVKPSEFSPASSKIIKEMLQFAFDEEYVATVLGGPEASTALLKQKFDHIFFTGSTRVGKIVMEAAAKHLTPVTLELGGKSPCIVDETADIALASRRIAWGKYLNAGQTCVAPDYILVQRNVSNDLTDKIGRVCAEFYSKEPLKNKDYPRIINKSHFDRLLSLMNDGKIIYGGNYDETSLKIEPTVLTSVKIDSPIMEEEIFGPLLPVIIYDDFNEAVSIVKEKPKPLALYLFTKSDRNKNRVLNDLSFGGGCINDTIEQLLPPELPFGGVGPSGMGSYHGKAGFDAFSHYKSVLDKSLRMDMSVKYPPYNNEKLKTIKKLLR